VQNSIAIGHRDHSRNQSAELARRVDGDASDGRKKTSDQELFELMVEPASGD
jgi:hypothetical protein